MKIIAVTEDSRFTPVGTIALLSIIFISFWLQWILNEHFVKSLYLNSFSLLQLSGHIFLHAHIIHLLINMALLYMWGELLEYESGIVKLITCFIICGLAAGIMHVIFNGKDAIGASGAISGLIGISLVLNPKSNFYFFDNTLRIPAWILAVSWIVKDIVFLMIPSLHSGSWGHLGGTLSGIVIGFIFYLHHRIHA